MILPNSDEKNPPRFHKNAAVITEGAKLCKKLIFWFACQSILQFRLHKTEANKQKTKHSKFLPNDLNLPPSNLLILECF